MKKLFTSMLCVFIAIPLLLTVWGFALPAQYGNTFVGELPAKRALLAAEVITASYSCGRQCSRFRR